MTCCHCKQEIKANPRLKGNQNYCGKLDCRQARKRLWQQGKMKNDQNYRVKQIDNTKRWKKKRHWDKYMIDYRRDNPEYVKMNRQKQTKRNKIKSQREKAAKIVKMDSLLASPEKTKTYEMTRLQRDSSGKIVKMDSLMVELTQIQPLSSRNFVISG
jgi:hypothetical protein